MKTVTQEKDTGSWREGNGEKPSFESVSSASSTDLKRDERVARMVRRISHNAVKDDSGKAINPFLRSDIPLLDPKSEAFDPRAWLENVTNIKSQDPERYPESITGIAYRNLSAHGFVEPTDYQRTFGNYSLKVVDLAKQLFGRQRRTKLQILKNFEGVLQSGEMLLVLGRPGR